MDRHNHIKRVADLIKVHVSRIRVRQIDVCFHFCQQYLVG